MLQLLHFFCLLGYGTPELPRGHTELLREYTKKEKFEKQKRVSYKVFMDFFKCRCARMFPLETLYRIINVKGFCNPGIPLPSWENSCSL